MPTLSDFSDHEDEHDIVAEYENRDSDGDQGNDRVGGSGSENEEAKEPPTARRIDPSTSKTHVVRNPIPKLNTERLRGPKGIQTIENYFEGFKFHGKGYEKADLDRIMKRMEHWAHRLFPKLQFDAFLDRVEKLGTKRDLQVFIHKYRKDEISMDDVVMMKDNMEEDDEKEQDEPIDEFDLLIAEQIEKQKQVAVQQTVANDEAFDNLLSQSVNQNSQAVKQNPAPSQLSNDVKERIERNRQQAIQRRLARLKAKQEEAKKQKLEEGQSAQLDNSICSSSHTSNATQNTDNFLGSSQNADNDGEP